jgi:hypothetical protein
VKIGEAVMRAVKCYFYPTELTPENVLTDGVNDDAIELTGLTQLIWVDLNPDLKFVHPTAYVLITASGIEIKEGQWWPVLDGQQILYGDTNGEIPSINCYFYPDDLTPEDVLVDGDNGQTINITGVTRLVWVDLCPDDRFAHPTAYVFISASGIKIQKGEWWPVLNGNRILYGFSEPITIQLPLEIELPTPAG